MLVNVTRFFITCIRGKNVILTEMVFTFPANLEVCFYFGYTKCYQNTIMIHVVMRRVYVLLK